MNATLRVAPAAVALAVLAAGLVLPNGVRADNFVLPISGVWRDQEGKDQGILRISNGQQMVAQNTVQGQFSLELLDQAGFSIQKVQGLYTFQQVSPTAGTLSLNVNGATVQAFEQEFANNNKLTLQFGASQVVMFRVP